MTVSSHAYERALAFYKEGDLRMCLAMSGLMLEKDFLFGPAHLLRAVSYPPNEVLLENAYLGSACRYGPHDAEAWFNRGVKAEALWKSDLAMDCYRRAHALDPSHLGTMTNGAQLLRITENFEEAVIWARKLQNLSPDNPAGFANEAISSIYLGDLERSDWAFSEAIRRSSDPSLLHWEQHFSLLARQRFKEAWRNYEYRFKCGSSVGVDDMAFDLPRWAGNAKDHVIAYGEQGLGDQIMFASMVAELAKDCAKVSLAVAPSLVRLFSASFPDINVYPITNGLDCNECANLAALAGRDKPVNSVIALGSLLARYRSERSSFSGETYLQPTHDAQSFWKRIRQSREGKQEDTLQIGICWASNPAPDRYFSARRALHKTMPLAAFSALVENHPEIRFTAITNVGLDQFEGGQAIKSKVEDVSEQLTDLDRTAALLQQMDLLITVDTGVAHLAGALGVPTWILLHQQGDARWGQWGASDSYWYRSVKLFWQTAPGDWDTVMARIGEEFERFIGTLGKQVES